MAVQYVDTDAVVNGDGSELSPYNIGSSVNLYSGDIIYVKGSADLLIESSGTSFSTSCILTNWPGSTKRETRIILSNEGSSYFRPLNFGLQAIGVHLAFRNNSTYGSVLRNYAQTIFKDCKISFLTGSQTACLAYTLNDLKQFSHCEIDMTNLEYWVRSDVGIGGCVFVNNEIHSFSSLTASAFNCSLDTVFRNNKFFNMDTAQGIFSCYQSDEVPTIEHNTFWITDTSTPVFNASGLDAGTTQMSFMSNVVAYQTSQPFVSNLLNAVEVGFRGNNLFHNATLGLYTPMSVYSDYTDLTNPFKSTTQGDSDFLELVATSNGKFADAIFDNTDLGAIQGLGNVLFPEVGEVASGVAFGNGVSGDRTGTRTDAPIGDVRDGVLYGDPDSQLEGTLVAYADDDVIESAGGNYVEVSEANVKAGIEYGAPSSLKTGQATTYNNFPTHLEVTVYTSDGSNISVAHDQASKIFKVAVGYSAETFLSDIGVSERLANGDAVEERDPQNQNFLMIKLVR